MHDEGDLYSHIMSYTGHPQGKKHTFRYMDTGALDLGLQETKASWVTRDFGARVDQLYALYTDAPMGWDTRPVYGPPAPLASRYKWEPF